MNKSSKILIGILASAMLLTSCSGTLVNLKYENGQMINERLKLAYTPAPTTYEPVSIGEAYAYYEKSKMTLYEMDGVDPKDWITQEYAGSATTVFYSDDYTLPSLEELNPNKVYVCSNEEITYSLATIEDAGIISELIDLFTNGEYVEWPLVDAVKTYELKFHSDDNYSFLYYNLTYGEFPEGKFIYDRNTKHSVMIGDLLDEYIK